MRHTGQIGRIALTAALVTALAVAFAAPGLASSGSIGPSDSSTSWSGQTFTAGATPSPAACTSATCDYFTLSVSADSSYWTTHDGHATVSIHWGDSADNFDLYVSGAGSSTSSSSTSESVSISNPSGSYTVTVVPKLVTASGYSGSATFASVSKPAPTTTGGSSGGSGSGSSGGGGKSSGGKAGGSKGSGSGGAGSGGRSTGGSLGGGTSGQGPAIFPYQPGPSVSGGSNPGGLYQVPAGGVFHYSGPYHFAPPFTFGGPGKLKPVSPPQPATQPQGDRSNPGGTVIAPVKAKPERIQAAPASSTPAGIPDFVWILIPALLILLAAAGAVVFEPEAPPATPTRDGTTRAPERVVIQVPPGPLVLLGFAVRRVVRAALNVAGGLFGGAVAGPEK